MKEASYTKWFGTWLSTEDETRDQVYEDDLIEDLGAIISDSSIVNKLVNELRHLYRYWEICDEDNDVFLTLLKDKILSYKDYYLEMLTTYQTQINFLDGRKTTISSYGSSNASNTGSSTSSTTNQDYLLPNKTINSGKGNLSQQNENSNMSGSTNTGNSSYADTKTVTGDVDVVEAKQKMLKLIRNLYYEWAKKCEDCFMGIFY